MKKIKTLIFVFTIMNMLNAKVLAYSYDEIDSFMENNDTLAALLGWIIIIIIVILVRKNRKKKTENKKKSENIKDLNVEDKGEILFKNETNVGETELKIFNRLVKKYNIDKKVITIIYGILFFIICSLILIAKDKEWLLYTIILIIFILIIFKIVQDAYCKNKKGNIEEFLYKYEFYSEYMIQHINNVSNTITAVRENSFKIITVKDICKYRGYIFFMLSRKEAFIINENNFTVGNKEEFEKYIQDKFNMKIKYYN